MLFGKRFTSQETVLFFDFFPYISASQEKNITDTMLWIVLIYNVRKIYLKREEYKCNCW